MSLICVSYLSFLHSGCGGDGSGEGGRPSPWNEELTRREEALTVREEKARISKKALVKVNIDLDAERAKTKAIHREYLDKMHAYTDRAKLTLGLDKMLGEKVQLDEKEWDLALWEAALTEAQAWGLNPWDNQ
jgi:hypothetical protein